VVSIYLLLEKIRTSKSVAGISFKTQAIYALVYVTRYLDILYRPWASWYNLFFKIVFISTSVYTLYLMQNKYRPSHNRNIDTFKVEYLLGGSAVMALIFNLEFSVSEIVWAFSIWLESVAVLPQLFMIQRTGEAESLTVHYIFALGIYRAFYVLNWIYRWIFNIDFDFVSFVAGIIQTGLYSDFFYVYYTKVMQGEKFELPQ
jgi:ER lumen protein retaining receptor